MRNKDCEKYDDCLDKAALANSNFDCDTCPDLKEKATIEGEIRGTKKKLLNIDSMILKKRCSICHKYKEEKDFYAKGSLQCKTCRSKIYHEKHPPKITAKGGRPLLKDRIGKVISDKPLKEKLTNLLDKGNKKSVCNIIKGMSLPTVRSKKELVELRISEIEVAVVEHMKARRVIPGEWLSEYNELILEG